MTLEAILNERRLSLLNSLVPEGLWKCNLGDTCDARSLFANVFRRTSVIPYVLHLRVKEIPDLAPVDKPLFVAPDVLVDVMANVAQLYNHATVNEVHLVLAMLHLFPWEFNSQIEVLNRMPECALQCSNISEELDAYLRSQYYPFRDQEFEDYNVTPKSDHGKVMTWFIAHRLREGWDDLAAGKYGDIQW